MILEVPVSEMTPVGTAPEPFDPGAAAEADAGTRPDVCAPEPAPAECEVDAAAAEAEPDVLVPVAP